VRFVCQKSGCGHFFEWSFTFFAVSISAITEQCSLMVTLGKRKHLPS